MMRAAEVGQVVRVVVAAVLIEVGDHYARLQGQAADNAAPELIGGRCYAPGFGLLAREGRRSRFIHTARIARIDRIASAMIGRAESDWTEPTARESRAYQQPLDWTSASAVLS